MMPASHFSPLLKNVLLGVAGLGWLAAAVMGLAWVWQYENTAGPTRAAPARWPAESQITRAAGMPSLVVFVHPRCPCSRATVGELAALMAEGCGRVHTTVVFYRPAGSDADWARTDLWDAAAAIPGVRVMDDPAGAEASRFDATVSGQTILYSADGRCQFTGGITMARGHAGNNAGRAAILALLRQEAPDGLATPVFGCSLLGPAAFATATQGAPASSISRSLP